MNEWRFEQNDVPSVLWATLGIVCDDGSPAAPGAAVMAVALLITVGLVSSHYWLFMVATFLFGIASFGNVPPLQMSVLKHGSTAPELACTANISAFNLANALGGIIGGMTVDSALGAAGIPWVAILIPVAGIAFVLFNRRNSGLNVQTAR